MLEGQPRRVRAQKEPRRSQGGKALLAGSSTAASAPTRWRSAIGGDPLPVRLLPAALLGAPFCQNLPASRWTSGWRKPSSRRSPRWSSTSTRRRWPSAKDEDDAEHARRQQLERLSYQAELARRRFERADPDNRLVAAELERRWEDALRELRRAEEGESRIGMKTIRSRGIDRGTEGRLQGHRPEAARDLGKDLLSPQRERLCCAA